MTIDRDIDLDPAYGATQVPEQHYHPNESEIKGPICFQDKERVCGPDCMAYLAKPPEGKAYLGEQWAHCHVLVNMDRQGRHLAILSQIVGEQVQANKNRAADAARQAQAPGIPGIR